MNRRQRRIAPLGQKWCSYGQHFVPETEFSGGYCKSCSKLYSATNDHAKKSYDESQATRKDAVDHYGGACFFCGESHIKALTIYPSKSIGVVKLSRFLRLHGWPKQDGEGVEYRVICHNCRHKRSLMKRKHRLSAII